MARTTFHQTVQRLLEVVLGVEPIGAAGMNRLQGYNQQMLGGIGQQMHTGMSGDPGGNFDGPMVNVQTYVGQTQMGAQGLSVPLDPAVALPSPDSPDGLPNVASPEFGDYMGFEYGMASS
jgi:hypothetical protein